MVPLNDTKLPIEFFPQHHKQINWTEPINRGVKAMYIIVLTNFTASLQFITEI